MGRCPRLSKSRCSRNAFPAAGAREAQVDAAEHATSNRDVTDAIPAACLRDSPCRSDAGVRRRPVSVRSRSRSDHGMTGALFLAIPTI